MIIYINTCKVFNDIIQKYLMENAYFNPYTVLFLQTIFVIICALISLYIEFKKKEIKIFSDGIATTLIFFISYFIISGLKDVFEILTLNAYSPTTIALAESVQDPIFIIRNIFYRKKGDAMFFVLNLIVSCITFFFSLVYNEFLILYCCGLEYNTHVKITKRGIDDDLFLGIEFEQTNKSEKRESNCLLITS